MAAKLLVLAAVILGQASAESSGMTQMMSLKRLLSKIETQTPEDAIMHLVLSKAEAAFGATPFGNSVKKIVEVIDKEMLPKVLDGHKADQAELTKLAELVGKCGSTKNVMTAIAEKSKTKYLKFSPLHKTCRTGEAGLYTTKKECYEELSDRKKIMDLKCKIYADIDAKLGNQNSNSQIVKKAGRESTEVYLNRLSDTFCGIKGGCGAKCGSPQCGFRCTFQCAKAACEKATKDHAAWTLKCRKIQKQYDNKQTECNNLQDQMDGAACKRAVDMKDACETYAECYITREQAFEEVHMIVKGGRHDKVDDKVTGNELDRHAEWKGLQRMQCLMNAFMDGKVEDKEIKTCKDKVYSTEHLKIKYPKLPLLVVCSVPKLYPTTGEYKKAEFAPLPVVAKGKEDANECTGVLEVSTTPASGSPSSCKCERLTLNGPYSPGPMVKCSNCLDVRKATDKASCPTGTKIFAPRTRDDWKTFLNSAQPLRAPHFIIDVTRPQNGCGGCTRSEMNSESSGQKSWVTTDGAPWWLRSSRYNEPNGDYHANCFLDLWQTPKNENSVTWNDGNCNYHSKSYYCQLATISLKPKPGSPGGCMCENVALTGKYSPGVLIKCKGCLDVYKSTQKNSCPMGTKIFAPRTRADWKTFIDSATPLRSPHWIIDVTRPANGCGGCTRNAMNFDNPAQKTWRTSDGTPWWLRSTTYNEPNGDYNANCYLDLWHNPPNENSITWNDGRCNYHANSYYCQLAKRTAPVPAPAPPPAPAAPTADYKSRNKACTYTDKLPGAALGKNAHTVIMSLSVKTDGFKKRQWLFNLGQAGSGANHWLWNNGNKLQFGAWGGTQISKGDIVKAKIVASVYDGKSYSLYIDGKLVEKKAVSNMDIKSGEIAVGTNNIYKNEDAFKGCVFGVNIYRKPLSANQIELASATMPTKK